VFVLLGYSIYKFIFRAT